MKILTVDDSKSTREMIQSILSENGFEVLEAVDGRDAITKLLNNPVHLILADLNMPNMDGLEMLRKLKKSVIHRSTPVIMITSEADKGKVLEAVSLGVEGWILKPFDSDILINTINRIANC